MVDRVQIILIAEHENTFSHTRHLSTYNLISDVSGLEFKISPLKIVPILIIFQSSAWNCLQLACTLIHIPKEAPGVINPTKNLGKILTPPIINPIIREGKKAL